MTSVVAEKQRLRDACLTRRRARTPAEREAAAEAIALHAASLPALTGVRRVAAYLSFGGEPGTGPLLALLAARGVETIVPISLDGGALDWVLLEPGAALTTTPLGIPEPSGPRLGPDALASAGLAIVPALAVDHTGHRLGRGAGYYDRVLATISAPICAVVHADELVPHVPHEPHDVPVDLVLTPAGVFRPKR